MHAVKVWCSLRLTSPSRSCYLLLVANNILANLSIEQLRRAISLKEQIAALEAQLNQVFGAPAPAAPTSKRPGSGKRSAATRAKMAAAHQARWAKIRVAKGAPAPAKIAPKAPAKRKISAEARRRMIEGAKARWAKASGKSKL